MPDFTLVDDPASIASRLDDAAAIGVDTEFMREKTYFAELCLVQLSAGSDIYCVDPLGGGALDAFWDTVLAKTWVAHSARQDIEVVYQAAGRMPAGLFDTQVAAGLAGYAPQIGYANLVETLFDARLPKSHTRADWSKRPLPHALLEYAAEDVEYLLPARDVLAARLDELGRLGWAEQDSAALLDAALYDLEPADAIDRVKGARRLRGQRRAAAARLAAWREREAIRSNRPRQWILRDNVLVDLAARQPQSTRDLGKVDGLAPRLAQRAGKALLAEIRESASDGNDYRPPAPPDETQKQQLKAMQAVVASRAEELGISAELIAPRRDLAAVVAGDRESRLFQGWRKELLGDDLAELL